MNRKITFDNLLITIIMSLINLIYKINTYYVKLNYKELFISDYIQILFYNKIYLLYNQTMNWCKEIFSNILGNISQSLPSLNPFNNFIKFSLDNIFAELTKNHKIKLDDIGKGCVSLVNLELDENKINKKHLFSSPYILHRGRIGNLKIQLPSLKQIQMQGICVEINEILLQLKPTENFLQNYKDTVFELIQHQRLNIQDQKSNQTFVQHNSHDYFKEFLKKMFLNLKIKVQNIVVMIYLDNPSSEIKSSPYYLLIRIPLVNLHKGNQKKCQEKKLLQKKVFEIQMPQLTIHLMSLNDQLPVSGFPFQNPQMDHFSTIFFFGLETFKEINIETDEIVPRVRLQMVTDYGSGEKITKIFIKFQKIQLMISPKQVERLFLFIAELNSFRKVLDKTKEQIGMTDVQINETLIMQMRRSSIERKESDDIFSSICMTIWQNEGSMNQTIEANKEKHDIINTIVQKDKNLKEEIEIFNAKCQSQVKTAHLQQEINLELAGIKFKRKIQFQLQISSFHLYLLKNNQLQNQKRTWMEASTQKLINPNLSTSYFLLTITKLSYKLKQQQNIWNLQFSDLILYDVKYKNPFFVDRSSSNSEFCDLLSSKEFYLIKQQPVVSDSHYCSHQIIKISQKTAQEINQKHFRNYNFFPYPKQNKQHQLYSPGFKLSSNKQNEVQIRSMHISISVNSQILRQILDLYLLISKMAMKNQKKEMNLKSQRKQKEKKKMKLQAFFQSINVVYLQFQVQNIRSIVETYKRGPVPLICYCNLQTQGIYLNIEKLILIKTEKKEESRLKRLQMGQFNLNNSEINRSKKILSIDKIVYKNKAKRKFNLIDQEKDYRIEFLEINVQIDEQTQGILNLVRKQLDKFKVHIQQIKKNIKIQQNELQTDTKTNLTNTKVQINVQSIRVKFISAQIYLTSLLYIKQQNQKIDQIISISSFVISINQHTEFYNTKIKNKSINFSKSPQIQNTHPQINNSNIILEICRQKKLQLKKENHQISKIYKKNHNFDESSILIQIVNNQEKQREIIKQEVSVKLSVPIYVSALNCLRFFNQKEKLISVAEGAKKQIQEILSFVTDPSKIQNELSMENSKQAIQHQVLNIQSGSLLIEIRPTFVDFINGKCQKSKQKQKDSIKQVVFSNSNSCINIQWSEVKINNCKKELKKYMDGRFSIKYYFQRFSEKNDHNDFSFYNSKDLKAIGFKELLLLKDLKVEIQKVENLVKTSLKICSINFETEIQTLSYLVLNYQHFINHDLKQKYGITIQEADDIFQLIDEPNSIQIENELQNDSTIQDLSNGFQIYTQKNQKKKTLEAYFIDDKKKPFLQPKPDKNCSFFLQKFSIEETKIKINSINNDESVASNVQIQLRNFSSCVKIYESRLQSLTKIQNLEIKFMPKQRNGFSNFISNFIYSARRQQFQLLKVNRQVQFIFEMNKQNYCLKFKQTALDLGFTSSILNYIDEFKNIQEVIDHSGWKKIYQNLQHPNQYSQKHRRIPQNLHELQENLPETKRLLIYIPKNQINLTLVLEGFKMLQNSKVKTPSLTIHEQTHNLDKIAIFVQNWVQKLIMGNIKGLIKSAALDSFGSLVKQIARLVKFLVTSLIKIFK